MRIADLGLRNITHPAPAGHPSPEGILSDHVVNAVNMKSPPWRGFRGGSDEEKDREEPSKGGST